MRKCDNSGVAQFLGCYRWSIYDSLEAEADEKRQVELTIREALEFEVCRRDVEIGALISCM
jgi:hypothetical protein